MTHHPARCVRTVLVAAVLAVAGLGACGDDDGDGEGETPTTCPADALLGPNGESFGRDPGQDCRFVDDDGRVITTQLDGSEICYGAGATVVPCE